MNITIILLWAGAALRNNSTRGLHTGGVGHAHVQALRNLI